MADSIHAAEVWLQKTETLLKFELEIFEPLSKRTPALEFQIPMRMDDGKMIICTGYRVIRNDVLRPSGGGTRVVTNLTLDEVNALAVNMTIKPAVAGVSAGGGNGGITAEPSLLGKLELERLCRAYTRRMNPKGAWIDIPGSDMGTDIKTMGLMLDEYDQIIGYHSPSAIDHRPVVLEGYLGIENPVGWGILYVVWEANTKMVFTPQSRQVVLQGSGLWAVPPLPHPATQDSKNDRDRRNMQRSLRFRRLGYPKIAESYAKETGSVVDFPRSKVISNQELLEKG